MNYRHIYHAGNFADVFKHIVLRMVLDYLQQKEKGLMVLDAFAGLGFYDLASFEAKKTKEFHDGIAKIMAASCENADLKAYQDVVAPDWALQHYPGSPLIAANMLRPQDRLIANELHPDDVEVLRKVLKDNKGAKVTHLDAYEAIRAHIPPPERRGVVLVDPPFENPEEFQFLVRQMAEWKRRWPTGCFVIWYPIKSGRQVDDLHNAAADLGMNRIWLTEFLLQKRDMAGGLNGCGLLIMNTPFGIPERVTALASELTRALGQGWVESHFITPES